MNKVEIEGGLKDDPAQGTGPGGVPYWTATLAVNGTRYDAAMRRQVVTTEWIFVKAWGPVAERLIEENLRQGDAVYVLGELSQRSVPGADGKADRKTRVNAKSYSVTRSASNRRRAAPDAVVGSDEPSWSDTIPPVPKW